MPRAAHFDRSAGQRIVARPASLPAALALNGQQAPDRPAWLVREAQVHRDLTWSEVADLVTRLAGRLQALGVRPGDAVLSAGRFTDRMALTEIAALAVGAIVVVVPPGTTRASLARVLQRHRPWLALTTAEAREPSFVAAVQSSGRVLATDVDDTREASMLTWGELWTTPADASTSLADLAGVLRAHTTSHVLLVTPPGAGRRGDTEEVPVRHSAWTYQGAALAAQGLIGREDRLVVHAADDPMLTRAALAAHLATACAGSMQPDADALGTLLQEVAPTVLIGTSWPATLDDLTPASGPTRSLRQRRQDEERQVTQRLGGSLRLCLSTEEVDSARVTLLGRCGVTAVQATTSPIAAGIVTLAERGRAGGAPRPLPFSETRLLEGRLWLRGPSVTPTMLPSWSDGAAGPGDPWRCAGPQASGPQATEPRTERVDAREPAPVRGVVPRVDAGRPSPAFPTSVRAARLAQTAAG